MTLIQSNWFISRLIRNSDGSLRTGDEYALTTPKDLSVMPIYGDVANTMDFYVEEHYRKTLNRDVDFSANRIFEYDVANETLYLYFFKKPVLVDTLWINTIAPFPINCVYGFAKYVG